MLLKLLILLLATLLAVLVYIYFVFLHRRDKRMNALLAVASFGLWAILAAGVVWFFVAGRFRTVFLAAILAVAVPTTIFALVSVLDFPVKLFFRRWPKVFAVAGGILAVAAFVGIVYGSVWGPTRFRVREVEFFSDELPETFDGYRIVQLSDIHLGGWQDRKREVMERVVDIANAQDGDAIMVTGDLVHHVAEELNGVEDVLGGLDARYGVFSVMGNHDYAPYYPFDSREKRRVNVADLRRRERAMGWGLLDNEHIFVERQVQGSHRVQTVTDQVADYSDLDKALKGVDKGGFSVLLSHDPTIWRREVLGGSGVDLTLSGHTHGGQFALGPFSFARLFYREWRGMYIEDEQGLYVNVGIGQVYPFRFGAWPEITVITLRKKR